MAFTKSFSRYMKTPSYPRWEEITLTEKEEEEQEEFCRIDNIRIMLECMEDAKKIIAQKSLQKYQSDLISLSIALFEKRSSHVAYYKEEKCKEKFDKMFGGNKG